MTFEEISTKIILTIVCCIWIIFEVAYHTIKSYYLLDKSVGNGVAVLSLGLLRATVVGGIILYFIWR